MTGIKKLLIASAIATFAATSAMAGGMAEPVAESAVTEPEGSMGRGLWLLIPLVACVLACGGGSSSSTTAQN